MSPGFSFCPRFPEPGPRDPRDPDPGDQNPANFELESWSQSLSEIPGPGPWDPRDPVPDADPSPGSRSRFRVTVKIIYIIPSNMGSIASRATN